MSDMEVSKLNLGEPSSEQLDEELSAFSDVNASEGQNEAVVEMLARQKEEQIRKLATNPSAIALSTSRPESGEGMDRVKQSVEKLFKLYLTNQFVSRAVNVRGDTLISKGYNLLGGDEKGRELCTDLIEDSGGVNLFWQLAVNTYIAGDGFLEKVYNKNKSKILRLKHVHPLTLRFKTDDKSGKILVDDDGEPLGYVQKTVDSNGKEHEKDVPKDKIEHLKFNTLGDEFTGISLIQPGYNTIVRLMNMEYSAAEAAIRTANPLVVGKANTKSPSQIAQWGQILGRISGRDQVFVPEGMEIDFMSPGSQNFNDYAEYFLSAVVSTFGVPKSVLLGASSDTSSNRAEGVILTRHFYSAIASDQKYIEELINGIFEEYAELADFEPPQLYFDDLAEDVSLMSDAAVNLYGAGIIDRNEAREMIGFETPDISGTGPDKNPNKGVKEEDRQIDRDTRFPEEPGSPRKKQDNIKSNQKKSPFSQVSPNTE